MENLTQVEMQMILGGTGTVYQVQNTPGTFSSSNPTVSLITPPFGNDELEE